MRICTIFIICLFIFSFCTEKQAGIDKEIVVQELDSLMDTWHHAAAVADEKTFFGIMDTNSVYLGTDPGERWLKQEFMDWGMKYFQRDTAWAFTPYNRIWEFTDDGNYAWFDELLETSVGVCRGSGVLRKYEHRWKIKQYNLALTIPNEKIDDFRKLNLVVNQ